MHFTDRVFCKQFHEEAAYNYKQVTSVWGLDDDFSTSNDAEWLYDVTLMTHMSTDRIAMLTTLIKHWEGPLTFSVYGSLEELNNFSLIIQKYPHIMQRNNINLNLVLKHGVSIDYSR